MSGATVIAKATIVASAALAIFVLDCSSDTVTAAKSCATGELLCGTACIDPTTDPANCGTCGTACKPSEVCNAGACSLTCSGKSTQCGQSCVDTNVSTSNCGGCGKTCNPGEICNAGNCAAQCPLGQQLCIGDGGAVSCVNPKSDAANCGGCGVQCGPGKVCNAGACADTCGAGVTLCTMGNKAYCANTQVDNGNCGTCGTVCGNGLVCVNGACGGNCGPGEKLCPGQDGGAAYCAVVQSDNTNCGSCGNVCGPGLLCSKGACVNQCGQGLSQCGQQCVDLNSDRDNCGQCNLKCSGGTPNCGSGKCINSIHNTVAWQGYSTWNQSCNMVQNGVTIGNFQYLSLGKMTWKACMVEGSKRNALVASPSYAGWPLPGWFATRQPQGNSPNLAMTGQWANYITADISTNQNCTLMHEPQAVALNQYASKGPLANTTSYDGNGWHYQDFGVMYIDQCMLLAGQYGGSVVTPWTLGLNNGDNYWQGILHTCSVYSWSTSNGTNFSYDNTIARQSQKGCMIAYVDN